MEGGGQEMKRTEERTGRKEDGGKLEELKVERGSLSMMTGGDRK